MKLFNNKYTKQDFSLCMQEDMENKAEDYIMNRDHSLM